MAFLGIDNIPLSSQGFVRVSSLPGSNLRSLAVRHDTLGLLLAVWTRTTTINVATSMVLYRNGVAKHTVSFAAGSTTSYTGTACNGTPVVIVDGVAYYATFVFRKGSSKETFGDIYLKKYDFATETETTLYSSSNWLDTSTISGITVTKYSGNGSTAICYNEDDGLLYVLYYGAATVVDQDGEQSDSKARLYAFTTAGVLTTTTVFSLDSGSHYFAWEPCIWSAGTNIYVAWHLAKGSKKSGSSYVDALSLSFVSRGTVHLPTSGGSVTTLQSGSGSSDPIGVGPFEMVLSSDSPYYLLQYADGSYSKSWNLTSYMDSSQGLAILYKSSSGDYYAMTEKDGTVYLLELSSGGTVTVLDSDTFGGFSVPMGRSIVGWGMTGNDGRIPREVIWPVGDAMLGIYNPGVEVT